MDHKFYKGAMVWVMHPAEAWIPATVCDLLEDCEIQVLFPNGNKKAMKITPETLIPRHICCDGDTSFKGNISEEEYQADVIDDLTKIPQIITPAVLHLLRVAYMGDQYYCKLGSGTLLALNPFKEVPNLVSTEMVRLYSLSTLKGLQNLPAHVYTIAQTAFAAVQARTGRVNQSIIVSGESGAGKTRTVGCLMRFLAEVEETRDVGHHYQKTTRQNYFNPHKIDVNAVCVEHIQQPSTAKISKITCVSDYHDLTPTLEKSCNSMVTHGEEYVSVRGHVVGDDIEKRVLNSNPVLEAFGNAQTTRNNNSSRFGKYIQLQYSRSGLLIGAKLKTYLLEKTRVVWHDHGERCYHIFYQMLYGSSQKQRDDWKLLSDPFSEDMEAVLDEMYMEHSLNFARTVKAMKKLGISDNMQDRIFKVLSAILHLRQLNFEGPDDLQNPCIICQDNPDQSKCLMIASELLGLDEQTVKKVITLRRISSHGDRKKSIFLRPSTVRECQIRRDCLLKFIYQILFEWIVRGVQERIRSVNSEDCSFLGLLDIYGFESFENNSLEQLCINFANEKLHHHFCTTFLKNLQEERCHEGVQDACCDLTKTEGCLLALEAPRNSLFSLLNEECKLNRANAEYNLKSRIETVFSESEHIKLPRISSVGSRFTISHFAGLVSYKTEFLIEKNKDEVPVEFIETLAMSKNGFVRQLVSYCQNEGAKSETSASDVKHEHVRHNKPMPTVLTRFKKSLDELLGILSTTDRHYIRCIKPNKESLPMVFDARFVLSQMEACGIVDTIRVCSSVYSCRMAYKEFHARYFFLHHDAKLVQPFSQDSSSGKEQLSLPHTALLKERCSTILKSVRIKGNSIIDEMMQLGKTKVFLSTDLFEHLEFLRSAEILKHCVVIQSAWRTYFNKKKCKARRKVMIAERVAAAVVLQKAWRSKLNARMCRLQRKRFISIMKKNVAVIESAWISYSMKKDARIFRKKILLERSAVKIQANFRGWWVRRQYKNLLAAQYERRFLQGVKCRDLDGRNPDSLTGLLRQACPSQDLMHSESQPHVAYFELISNSSANRTCKPLHPEIYKSKLAIYHDTSGRERSPPDVGAQADARRIVLLDHQNMPSKHKSEDANTARHAFHCNNLYLDQQSLRTGNTAKRDNVFRNNYNFNITPHCHEMTMASAWHRLPSVCVMSYPKSFLAPFSQTIFRTVLWDAGKRLRSHSPKTCPVATQNLSPLIGKRPCVIHDFITNSGSSSILKYADVLPDE